MPRNRWRRALGAAATVALLATACGGPRAVRPADVQTKARRGYLNGLLELQDGNFQQAVRHFNEVAASPRYFRYTALASLRVADTLFHQRQFAQAVAAYQSFIKRFAGDPNIPYAEFRIAQSHFERIPGDWWFLPPAHEKELATTRSAYQVLSRFLRRHPRHRFAPQARRMLAFCAQRLYENEMYVADFYEGRDKPRGAAQRIEAALEEFPALARTEDNLLRLAGMYADAQDAEGTRSALERYLAAFPEGERVEDVQSWLRELTPASTDSGEDGDEAAPTED